MEKPKLLFLVGPTASGKTDLAILLAGRLGAEIISADSMLVYRQMNLGTAKPSNKILESIPHHLINVVGIESDFSVFEYRRAVLDILNSEKAAGKTFIIVGGTGLYVAALLHGISDKPGANNEIREKYNQLADEKGLDYLKGLLEKVDPEYSKIAKDKKRIVRALEVYDLSGKTVTEWNAKTRGLLDEELKMRVYGLQWSREILRTRIKARTEKMLESGLVDEVTALRGRRWSKTAKKAIGYAEVFDFFDGKLERAQLGEVISQNTSKLVKRQTTWFRKEKNIMWLPLDVSTDIGELSEKIIDDWKENA